MTEKQTRLLIKLARAFDMWTNNSYALGALADEVEKELVTPETPPVPKDA